MRRVKNRWKEASKAKRWMRAMSKVKLKGKEKEKEKKEKAWTWTVASLLRASIWTSNRWPCRCKCNSRCNMVMRMARRKMRILTVKR